MRVPSPGRRRDPRHEAPRSWPHLVPAWRVDGVPRRLEAGAAGRLGGCLWTPQNPRAVIGRGGSVYLSRAYRRVWKEHTGPSSLTVRGKLRASAVRQNARSCPNNREHPRTETAVQSIKKVVDQGLWIPSGRRGRGFKSRHPDRAAEGCFPRSKAPVLVDNSYRDRGLLHARASHVRQNLRNVRRSCARTSPLPRLAHRVEGVRLEVRVPQRGRVVLVPEQALDLL